MSIKMNEIFEAALQDGFLNTQTPTELGREANAIKAELLAQITNWAMVSLDTESPDFTIGAIVEFLNRHAMVSIQESGRADGFLEQILGGSPMVGEYYAARCRVSEARGVDPPKISKVCSDLFASVIVDAAKHHTAPYAGVEYVDSGFRYESDEHKERHLQLVSRYVYASAERHGLTKRAERERIAKPRLPHQRGMFALAQRIRERQITATVK